MEHSNISEASSQVSDATKVQPVTETNVVDNEDQTQSSEAGNISDRHQLMYGASLRGDCVAAEMLLEGDPKLGCDKISEEGDRALHVATAMKHHKLVQKLVERMSPSELASVDGLGYTACCYAAILGSKEIVDLMMRKNPTLAAARDKENKTPLQQAAFHGNADIVTYFLESAKAEDLSTQEWIDLLLLTIRRKMYGVASDILAINELTILPNDQGTALHLLAGQNFYNTRRERMNGVMRSDMRLLAKKLWTGIRRLGQCSEVVELMKKQPILHKAAKIGNIELITIITHTYPHLVWLTDCEGYTIFHIAVKHRQEGLFGLINEIGVKKDLIALWQDENGNNILHLVGDSVDERRRVLLMSAFEMQREMLWFEKVKEIVPPQCLEMKNGKGQTAKKLFFEKHESLSEDSRKWMRDVTDFCMLIATIIFTVVFGSAFAVPGGYNDKTGIPNLLGDNWFTSFAIFEALAMLSSACSIMCFLRIMMVGMKKEKFRINVPDLFAWGLNALSFSVISSVSVFISAYFLVYVERRAAPLPVLLIILIIAVYVAIACAVCSHIYSLLISLPKHRFRKHTRHALFLPPDAVVVAAKKRRFWVF